jgi:hypothetical protein
MLRPISDVAFAKRVSDVISSETKLLQPLCEIVSQYIGKAFEIFGSTLSIKHEWCNFSSTTETTSILNQPELLKSVTEIWVYAGVKANVLHVYLSKEIFYDTRLLQTGVWHSDHDYQDNLWKKMHAMYTSSDRKLLQNVPFGDVYQLDILVSNDSKRFILTRVF